MVPFVYARDVEDAGSSGGTGSFIWCLDQGFFSGGTGAISVIFIDFSNS